MIEFNWRQWDTFTSVFGRVGSIEFSDATAGDLALDNNNVFNKLCVIDITGDNIEIPVFSRPAVESVIKDNINIEAEYTKVVLPIYVNTYPQSRRTSDNIIRDFFRVNLSQRLQKVTTNKGEVYYGGKGMIFDKDFNLLLMCTMSCEKVIHENRDKMKYTKITVYVHPKVFLESEGLIHKAIIKKVIPFYISHNIVVPISEFFLSALDITTNVVIADAAKKFIEVPKKPTPQRCFNDVLNQILIDNIDDVLNQIV